MSDVLCRLLFVDQGQIYGRDTMLSKQECFRLLTWFHHTSEPLEGDYGHGVEMVVDVIPLTSTREALVQEYLNPKPENA